MKIKRINKRKEYIYKKNGDLKVGDTVITPFWDFPSKILSIQKQGVTPVYSINLSNGKSFKTNLKHYNTVNFVNENGRDIWITVSTEWLMKNLGKCEFRFPEKEELELSHSYDLNSALKCYDDFSLKGKRLNKDRVEGKIYIDSIIYAREESNSCITLDYPLGLYLIHDNIITHNSTMSSISELFVTVTLWSMRSPKKFFNLSESSSMVTMLVSFTMEKAAQVLLQPFMQILKSSPKFRRVKQEERLVSAQDETPDKVCWTTAGRMGSLQFFNDLHYIIASDPAQLLGLNVIQAVLSEISFFVDKGFSPEYIWRIYNDSLGRVQSRFDTKYYSGTILDSSPNDITLSPIDKYIFGGAAYEDPTNYIFTGTQWQYRPELRPIWLKTGETFPVFRGSATEPAKILEENEVANYNKEEVYDVPIDLKKLFVIDCLKNVKDYCGYPAGAKGMLIRDEKYIDSMFVDTLRNVYTYIIAPEGSLPNHLIWDTIYKRFWIKYDKGYEFYRAPNEKRYLHIDQSESGDVASIAMVHPELDPKTGTTIVVTDFTIPISPEKQRINLDAIRYFIVDLVEKGRINLALVTFDQYQSSSTRQYLKLREIPCEKLSVDSSTAPYYTLVSYMMSGKVKCGKNILLKNNLKSLQETETQGGKKKIDHTKGKTIYEDGGDWMISSMGKFAKDVSDSLCGAVWNCVQNFTVPPKNVWEESVMRGGERSVIENKKQTILAGLQEKYGFLTDNIKR